MDDDDRDLVNHLFATATAMLENAVGVAVEGQSAKLDPKRLVDLGRRLQAVARDIVAVADAAVIIANLVEPQDPDRSKAAR